MSARMSLVWVALVAALWFGRGPVAAAGAGKPAAPTAAYDLTVIVYAPDVGPAQVAISYPRVVDHAAIEKGLGELAGRTGAVISAVKVTDGQRGQGMSETGTAVEFSAVGLIRQAQGSLPVGAVIKSLPEWEHMRLAFLVGEAFRWTGPGATTAEGFAVRVVSSMKPIEYDVERKSEELAPPAPPVEEKPVSLAVLPAVLIGLPAGFATGWLVAGERQRGGSRSGRQ